MSDPFAKWRERQAVQTAPAVAAPDRLIAEYHAVNYLNRAWTLPLLLLWAAALIGLVIVFALYEPEIKAAVPFATFFMVLAMLLVVASVALVFLVLLRRRHWRLFADRLEILQVPIVRPIGRRLSASIPLGDIVAAAQADLIGGLRVVEITVRGGNTWRLSPGRIGTGRDSRVDLSGFDTFVDAIADAVVAAGHPLPAGTELRTLWDTPAGLICLLLILGFGGLMTAGAVWLVIAYGELRGGPLAFIGLLFVGIARDVLRRKWLPRRGGG